LGALRGEPGNYIRNFVLDIGLPGTFPRQSAR
jgi:hypothetical protein